MERLYVEIARTVRAYENCCNSPGHAEWKLKHAARLQELVHEYMPSGSGLNNGTSLNFAKSDSERLVFETSFHHMNENGLYDGWTEHTVVVTASLMFGVNIRITGRNRNDIKEYLYALFQEALLKEVS